jgi:hypothetical protein
MALYVDELMKLIKMNNSSHEKIAIISPVNHNFGVSSLCDLTNLLCDSGYSTEFGMKDNRENYRWIITINPKSDKLDLTDTKSGSIQRAVSTKDIIKFLQRNK